MQFAAGEFAQLPRHSTRRRRGRKPAARLASRTSARARNSAAASSGMAASSMGRGHSVPALAAIAGLDAGDRAPPAPAPAAMLGAKQGEGRWPKDFAVGAAVAVRLRRRGGAAPGAVRKQVESSMLVTGAIDIQADGAREVGFKLDREEKLPPEVTSSRARNAPRLANFESGRDRWPGRQCERPDEPAHRGHSSGRRWVSHLDPQRVVRPQRIAGRGTKGDGREIVSAEMTPPSYPRSAQHVGNHRRRVPAAPGWPGWPRGGCGDRAGESHGHRQRDHDAARSEIARKRGTACRASAGRSKWPTVERRRQRSRRIGADTDCFPV